MSDRKRKPGERQGLPIPIPDADTCPPRLAKMIDKLVLGDELNIAQQRELTRALEQGGAARSYYDRAMLAQRLLDGGPESLFSPSAAEFSRVEERIFERVREEQLAAAPARRGIFAWVAGLVAVGAAVAIALPFLLASKDAPPATGPATGAPTTGGEFQIRGQAARRGKQVGLRVFCFDKKASPAVRELGDSANRSCPLSATLKLAYTNKSELKQLFVVGVDDRREPLWYAPVPPAKTSLTVSKAVDQPLPRAIRLQVNHHAGELRIYAVFSAKALTFAEIATAVHRLKKGSLARQELLPIEDTEQRSMLLTLQ